MATPTRAKQRLGKFLQNLRMRADVTTKDAAVELKSTLSTVTRYESGQVLPAWGTVRTLLAHYGATADEHKEASYLYDVAADEPPPVRLPSGAPKAFRRLVNAERDGTEVRVIEPLAVPGLLQTEGYARAINAVDSRYVSDDHTQAQGYVVRRLSRQRRLDGPDPLVLHAVIDEGVILRIAGSHVVMRHQLEHLLAMAERPNVTLQVVPFGAGVYGTMSGSCAVVLYRDGMAGVYLEYPTGGAWVENVGDVRRFTAMFDDVVNLALTPDRSAELIRRRVRELEGQ